MEALTNPPSLPVFLPYRDPFVGAIHIDLGWNATTLIAEVGEMHVAFLWTPSA
jgi:hypothetical protein